MAGALRETAADGRGRFIAGGTNLIDLMQENAERPGRMIDISRLPLGGIHCEGDGGLQLVAN